MIALKFHDAEADKGRFLSGSEGLKAILELQNAWAGRTLLMYSENSGVTSRLDCFDRVDRDLISEGKPVTFGHSAILSRGVLDTQKRERPVVVGFEDSVNIDAEGAS
jgi:hypothetical protein